MSDIDSASTPNEPKDRHEPRGRKPNDHLPPSRAREVQRAFRLRRAEHLAALEERINILENENMSLRALLALPEADRPRIGSGPTGKGKSLKEGGVPMSERVRARKEARERERRAKAGLPVGESSELELSDGRGRDSATLSPGVSHASVHGHGHAHAHAGPGAPGPSSSSSQQQQQQNQNSNQLSLFTNPAENSQFNYQLPMPFNIPVSPDNSFDFASSLDSMLKPGSTPNFGSMFNMFGNNDEGGGGGGGHGQNGSSSHQSRRRSMSPPPPPPAPAQQQQQQQQQPDLLTRLKSCCHLSDSHVVNDPGLLIFATRLCQSFPCQFGGMHVEVGAGISDSEHLMLEDSWRALKNQLDPGGEADGENRINTGRMAAELVVRAAHSRGPSGWILCRYREGMSIKTSMIRDLVQGLGGKLE